MVQKNKLDHEEDSTCTPENVAEESTFSGDEAYEVTAPSHKKRKGAQKKVITVPIGEGDGSRSKAGEVYPPPDSWSWRKYGQKPIKGSPYPRGYYRCSSSKGCPARKQVERSCLDPTKLLITYSCEHNHPIPTTTKHHNHHPIAAAAATPTASATATTDDAPSTTVAVSSTSASASSTATTTTTDDIPVKLEDGYDVFGNRPDIESDNSSGFNELAGELGWFSDVGSTCMVDSPTLMGPMWVDADVALMLPIGEEDQSLFGDLGELPECSVVFRRRSMVGTPCCAGSG